MKKYIFSAALILISFSLKAQDKKLSEIEKLYQTGAYDQCSQAVIKYNGTKNPDPVSYFYSGLSYFKKYVSSRSESSLKRAEQIIYQGYSKTKSLPEKLSGDISMFHDTVSAVCNYYFAQNNLDKANDHAEMLVKIFQDTTEVWLRKNKPQLFLSEKIQGKTLAEYTGPTNQTDISGKRQGVWIERWPNGLRKSQINFKGGVPDGEYYKFYQSGGLKVQMYFYSPEQSSAILYDENGDKAAMGYYLNHAKDSLWQYYNNDSIVVAEENYRNGKKHGSQYLFFPFGQAFEIINWENGVKHGLWQRYYTNGQKQFEATYVNGELNGTYTKYSIDGKPLFTGNYTADLKTGKWKLFDEKTGKYNTLEYINGVLSNQDEVDLKQTQEIEAQIERAKELPDPEHYADDPTQYPANK